MDPSCPICGHDSEDILHIIRDYTLTKEVWNQVVPRNLHFSFFSNTLHDWMSLNLQDTSTSRSGDVSWAYLFGIVTWHLWKNQNMFIFQGKLWSSTEIIKFSVCWAKHFSLSNKEVVIENLDSSTSTSSVEGRFFLNTDDTV